MEKNSFFDTNIIINYAYYYEGSESQINKKCFIYIKNKIAKFIICYFVEKELFNFIKNRATLHKEILNKIENFDYSFENSLFLSKREIPYAKKLYEVYKNNPLEEVAKIFSEERNEIEIKIERFLKTKLDEKVIPIENINIGLLNALYNTITNHADCKILASALQLMQEKEEDFYLVTADAKDLSPNSYDFLKDDPKLEDYKFPTLKNLMFEN